MAENSPSNPHRISPPLFQSRYRRFPFSFIHFIHLFLLLYWVLPISIQPCHKFSPLKNGLFLTSAAFRFCHFLLLEIVVSDGPQNSFQWFLISGKNPKSVQRLMGCFRVFLLSLSRDGPTSILTTVLVAYSGLVMYAFASSWTCQCPSCLIFMHLQFSLPGTFLSQISSWLSPLAHCLLKCHFLNDSFLNHPT